MIKVVHLVGVKNEKADWLFRMGVDKKAHRLAQKWIQENNMKRVLFGPHELEFTNKW